MRFKQAEEERQRVGACHGEAHLEHRFAAKPREWCGNAAADEHQRAHQRGGGARLCAIHRVHRFGPGDGADAAHKRHGEEQPHQRQHRVLLPGEQ